MSKRDRFGNSAAYLIAFVGLFFVLAVGRTVFYSEGHQSARESYEAEKAEHAAADNLQKQCLSLGVVDEIRDCLSRRAAPSREEKRSEEDLNAQREMADWAKGMLWASWFGTIVTTIGIFFVGWTLVETRKAVRAAEDAVTVTREIGEAQARSYLNITKASFIATTQALDAFLYIKNSGPTPAVGLSADCQLMTYEEWDGRTPYEPVMCQMDFGVAQVVGANDVEILGVKWRKSEVTSDGFDRVVARHPKCIVKIDLTWTDVFKKKQTSRFILNALPANGVSNIPRPYRGDFRVQYVFTGEQN